jgi:HD-GYP domain-containing protein (c-di-GMP phosphodiesterase class II)
MLTKPCNVQSFYKAIEDGLRQHELITVEKSLLDQTLKGAVHMLGDIISVMDHGAFGRGHKMAIAAREIAKIVGIKDLWEVEVAATLAEIGRVTLPGAVSHKRLGITQNTEAETSLLTRLPEFSARLLSQIPRLETVSKAVLYQSKNYDGSGFPDDRLREDYIPMPARILHALNYLVLESEKERDLEIILDEMALYNKKFDRIVVEACKEILPLLQRILTKPLKEVAKKKALIKDLAEGQRLASNIETKDGIIIVNAGTILRPAVLQRIQNFATIMPIKEPIEIEQD